MLDFDEAFRELETLGFTRSDLGLDFHANGLELGAVRSFDVFKGGDTLAFCGQCLTKDHRRAEQYEFSLPLQNLANREALIAFLAYYLHSMPEECRPNWYDQGRALKHLLPWEATKGNAPKPLARCSIDADWFRVLRARLKAEIADCVDADTLSLHFDGECLRLEGRGLRWLVQAFGEAWPRDAAVHFRQLVRLRSRLAGSKAEIVVWERKIDIAGAFFELITPWQVA